MDIVERLRFDATRCELQFSKGVASNIEEAAAEIDRLRAREREAFRAGYWAWCGPANQPEYDEAVKDELEAWDKWSASVGVEQSPGEAK